jgi:uncharacterized protein with NRDE domain
MCLIGFHWQPEAAERLLVLGNRDEFYDRPSASMGWWEDGRILAGRDLRADGTWMGVSRTGRFAAITNFRDPAHRKADAPSRGAIPTRFLSENGSAESFLDSLQLEAGLYNPFNLLLLDGQELWGFESRKNHGIRFQPGWHAVSNGDFDEPWPKVEALLTRLAKAGGNAENEVLLALLETSQPFEDDRLPRTGVSIEWERALSPIFIRTPTYGTRASTLIRLGRDTVAVTEQRFTAEEKGERSRHVFVLD